MYSTSSNILWLLKCRKETVADALLRCVKRGKTEEQTQAAKCICLLALTLGADLEGQYNDIQAVLAQLLADNSASVPTRSWVSKTKNELPGNEKKFLLFFCVHRIIILRSDGFMMCVENLGKLKTFSLCSLRISATLSGHHDVCFTFKINK
jgi:hypothetical protein